MNNGDPSTIKLVLQSNSNFFQKFKHFISITGILTFSLSIFIATYFHEILRDTIIVVINQFVSENSTWKHLGLRWMAFVAVLVTSFLFIYYVYFGIIASDDILKAEKRAKIKDEIHTNEIKKRLKENFNSNGSPPQKGLLDPWAWSI
jgi:hypothetical protein